MTGFVDRINTANQSVDRSKKLAASLAGKSRLLVTLWSLSKQNYRMRSFSLAVAYVAAVSFQIEQRTKEHA